MQLLGTIGDTHLDQIKNPSALRIKTLKNSPDS